MSTYALVFTLGVLFGRKASAKMMEVDPVIEFLPLLESEQLPQINPDEVVEQLMQRGFSRELATEFFVRLQELKAFREYTEALVRVERCKMIIRKASRALNEKRISGEAFNFMIQRYMNILIEASNRLDLLEKEADRELDDMLKQLLSQRT